MECDLSESVGPQGLAVVDRAEVTGLVRAVSNRENTRVKSQMGKTLDGMLLRRGVVTVPAFADTASPYVMLVRLGTTAARIWDWFGSPTPEKGDCLVRLLRQMQGHIRVT